MFEKCELYYYDGLYLDEEAMNKINIQITNGIRLVTALQECVNVYELDNYEKRILDRDKLILNVLSSDKRFCFTVCNNDLIILPITIYYGIKSNDQLLAFWDDEKIREAKLASVKAKGIMCLISDINHSVSIVDNYKKQLQLKKAYNSLVFNS